MSGMSYNTRDEQDRCVLYARIAELRGENDRLIQQVKDLEQVQRWADGLVTETQRLQGIEQRAEVAEAEVERLNRRLAFLNDVGGKGWCEEHPRRFSVNAREGEEGTYDECQKCRAEDAEAEVARLRAVVAELYGENWLLREGQHAVCSRALADAEAEVARACTGCESPLPILCRECYRKDMAETRQRAEVAEVDRSKYRAASLDLMGQMDALREALDAMVNCPVGGSGQRLPAPEVVAFARAVLRGKGEK